MYGTLVCPLTLYCSLDRDNVLESSCQPEVVGCTNFTDGKTKTLGGEATCAHSCAPRGWGPRVLRQACPEVALVEVERQDPHL